MSVASPKRKFKDSPATDGEQILQPVSRFFFLIFGGAFVGIVLSLSATQLSGPLRSAAALCGGVWIAFCIESRRWYITLAKMVFYVILIIGSALAMRVLAGMATAGVYGADKASTIYFDVQIDLIAGMLWLLIGVPSRAFKFRLDREGKGTLRNTLTSFLTLTASILAGVYIMILHYGGGPFQGFNFRALIVGDIFTIILLPPIFRPVAESSWKRGPIGTFSLKPLAARWLKAGLELDEEWTEYRRIEVAKSAAKRYTAPADDIRTQQSNRRHDWQQHVTKPDQRDGIEARATPDKTAMKTTARETAHRAANGEGGIRPPRNKPKKPKRPNRR